MSVGTLVAVLYPMCSALEGGLYGGKELLAGGQPGVGDRIKPPKWWSDRFNGDCSRRAPRIDGLELPVLYLASGHPAGNAMYTTVRALWRL